MPKTSKIKEDNDLDDENDVVIPLPISTTVTESQSTVTSSTSYNWSAIPSASPDHWYCKSEESMFLPSYSDLVDEIKELKIENNILRDKIKASQGPIKVLVQQHDKFTWKKINTDPKIRFYTGIASVALFNTIFTLSKPYIHTYLVLERTKTFHANFKRNWKEKMSALLNPHDEFFLRLTQLWLGLLNECVADCFNISLTKP